MKTFPDGKQEIVEGDMVDRSRLMVDTRKWLLSKMFPKKYGDKVNLETEVSGPGGAPIPMQHTIVFVKPDGTSGVLPERNESK